MLATDAPPKIQSNGAAPAVAPGPKDDLESDDEDDIPLQFKRAPPKGESNGAPAQPARPSPNVLGAPPQSTRPSPAIAAKPARPPAAGPAPASALAKPRVQTADQQKAGVPAARPAPANPGAQPAGLKLATPAARKPSSVVKPAEGQVKKQGAAVPMKRPADGQPAAWPPKKPKQEPSANRNSLPTTTSANPRAPDVKPRPQEVKPKGEAMEDGRGISVEQKPRIGGVVPLSSRVGLKPTGNQKPTTLLPKVDVGKAMTGQKPSPRVMMSKGPGDVKPVQVKLEGGVKVGQKRPAEGAPAEVRPGLKQHVEPKAEHRKVEGTSGLEVKGDKKTPLAKQVAAGKPKVEDESDDDDVPLAAMMTVRQGGKSGPPPVKKKPVDYVKKTKELVSAKVKATGKGVPHKSSKSIAAAKAVKSEVAAKRTKTQPAVQPTEKWTTLEHSGVIFPPPYQPHGVKMLYDGKPVDLTPEQEEVATFFAVMKDTDYATKPTFVKNFWHDFHKVLGKNHVIQRLELCDFTPIYNWHMAEKEKKKNMTSEEKKKIKAEKEKLEEKYSYAIVDGVKEKVGNFRVEPPGLFRGRGEHPKMGKLKARIVPEDIVINVGKDAKVPECPIPGHKWGEVRRDNTVTWLAYWRDPINSRECKYVFLAPSSGLKGQSDKEKYEKARKLKDHIVKIREDYTRSLASTNKEKRQIAVAVYLIDRLALRAGNEKDEDEADTVGCCSLRASHVKLVPPHSIEFDFLGKDSIRYFNVVEVDERVYSAIGDFLKGKKPDDDLFDMLDTSKVNAHLKGLMPQLTAKVFRTYNASITLDTLLQDTDGAGVVDKVASYQRANKEVAILCNHQRTVSKGHDGQMARLDEKMKEMQKLMGWLKEDLTRAKQGKAPVRREGQEKSKKAANADSLKRQIEKLQERMNKMVVDMRIKDELKTVALGTSKINYMDPRITIAWCKKHEVPIEKVFNKSLLSKFAWAMDVELEYRF